jgi:trk system potassium uptake protein TrkH
MKYNFKSILSILSILLIFNGGFMLLCLPFALYYGESWQPILLASCLTLFIGILGLILTYSKEGMNLKNRDGFLIVTLGWLVLSISGTSVYMFTGSLPDFTYAFFETMSGYTTTGATILTDIEAMPKAVLFWRSLTQWIGGMGIIVLAVAILPLLGIGGMQLFVAEAPGITPDKLKPRIRDTAKRLWLIYVLLTASEAILLMFGGMNFYDAINHALTTMATGGFSTKNASIAHFDTPFIHYIIILFMIIGGTNFTLIYFTFKGALKKVWANEEFRVYLSAIGLITLLVTVVVFNVTNDDMEKSLRDSLFQVVSVITTTGYSTADYTAWIPFLTIGFFGLMFVGASAGSTSGGVKIVRHLILFKNSSLELKRQLNPDAVIPVRLNGRAVTREITSHVLAFMIVYLTMFSIGCVMLAWTGLDFETALGAAAACIGNVGPGLGDVGPDSNFASVSPSGKWILAFLMLIGRLELFTVLILFTPAFWRQ